MTDQLEMLIEGLEGVTNYEESREEVLKELEEIESKAEKLFEKIKKLIEDKVFKCSITEYKKCI